MDRDEVIDRLRRSEGDLRRLGVKSLRLFGSVARGEAMPGSESSSRYVRRSERTGSSSGRTGLE